MNSITNGLRVSILLSASLAVFVYRTWGMSALADLSSIIIIVFSSFLTIFPNLFIDGAENDHNYQYSRLIGVILLIITLLLN